jgi:hypothetical protein
MLAQKLFGAAAAEKSISFVGYAFSGSFASSSSYSQPIPNGLAGDDLFICAAHNAITARLWSMDASWTLVGQLTTSNNRLGVFHKKATTASESNAIVSINGTPTVAGVCLRFRGAASYIGGSMSASATSTSTATSINMTSSGLLFCVYAAGTSSRLFGAPSGFSTLFIDSNNTPPSFGVFAKDVLSGSTGDVSSTYTGGISITNAIQIGLI